MGVFSILIVVMITQLCQIHRVVQLQSVHFLHVNYGSITLILTQVVRAWGLGGCAGKGDTPDCGLSQAWSWVPRTGQHSNVARERNYEE